MSEKVNDALYALAMAAVIGGVLWVMDSGPRSLFAVAGFIALNTYFGIRNGRKWEREGNH